MKNKISITKKATNGIKALVSHSPSIVNKDCSEVAKSLNAKDFDGIMIDKPYGIIANGLTILPSETKRLLQ
jgi:DNA modification methylase